MSDGAGEALSANQTTVAILALEDFIKHVDVLMPRRIREAIGADLMEFARDLVNLLEGTSHQTRRKSDADARTPTSPRGRPDDVVQGIGSRAREHRRFIRGF